MKTSRPGTSFEIEPLRGEAYEDRPIRDDKEIEARMKDLAAGYHGHVDVHPSAVSFDKIELSPDELREDRSRLRRISKI